LALALGQFLQLGAGLGQLAFWGVRRRLGLPQLLVEVAVELLAGAGL
jgi:hypothetical protein